MALATNPLVPKDGSIVITDGAALSLTINYEDGDFSVSGLQKDQRSTQVFRNRGKTYSVRETDDTDIEFSFSCHAISLVGDGTTATIGDVVRRSGVWVAATSTLPAASGDAYCVQVKWTGERTNFGATSDTSVTLKYCHLSLDYAEGIPGKLSIKGTAYCISTDYITIA